MSGYAGPSRTTWFEVLNIEGQGAFTLMLIFLFSINFSIFVCYLAFSLLTVQFIVSWIRGARPPAPPPFFRFFLFFCHLSVLLS